MPNIGLMVTKDTEDSIAYIGVNGSVEKALRYYKEKISEKEIEEIYRDLEVYGRADIDVIGESIQFEAVGLGEILEIGRVVRVEKEGMLIPSEHIPGVFVPGNTPGWEVVFHGKNIRDCVRALSPGCEYVRLSDYPGDAWVLARRPA